ncbi:hypothetical protein LUW77_01590 [Streptomyces radiopugnans]|nr:hypothetical protein LUW77_01590 [Streptomyces radiopugnans]
MSDFTDVLLLFNYLEDEAMEHLVELDLPGADDGGFRRVSADHPLGHWGGRAGAECHVVAGTFDHLNTVRLRRLLQTVPWKCPHGVQLLLHNENDAIFSLWMLVDERWVEVPLPRTARHPSQGHLRRTDCPDDEFRLDPGEGARAGS